MQKKLTLRATIEVTYDLNGASVEEMKYNLDSAIFHLFGEGAITRSSEAEVDKWDVKIVEP